MIFNKLQDIADMLENQFSVEHTISRAEATLTLTAMIIKPVLVPAGATHYRVQNHLSIISDHTRIWTVEG